MSDPSAPPPPAAAVTLFLAGRNTGRFLLDATVDNTLGRSTQTTITIPDRLASRAHAAIRFHTARREWVLRDTGSRNGTWLGGRRIDVVPLLPGAVIRIGTSELVFELAEEEVRADAAHLPAGGEHSQPPSDGHAVIDLDEPVRQNAAANSRISRHGTVVLKHAPPAADHGDHTSAHSPPESVVMQLESLNLRDWQRALIIEALRRHAGDARAAAVDLGVNPERLHDVLARHGLVHPA